MVMGGWGVMHPVSAPWTSGTLPLVLASCIAQAGSVKALSSSTPLDPSLTQVLQLVFLAGLGCPGLGTSQEAE